MFFKDICSWTDKKLKTNYVIYTILYFCFTLLAPIIVIGYKYGIFNNAVKERAINGLLIILILIVIVSGLRSFKKVVDKMPDVKVKDQRWKYSLQCVYAVAVPCVIVFMLFISHNQLELAYNTALWCIGFFIVGVLIDNLFIKFIDKQRELRLKVDEREELEKIESARLRNKKR